MHILLMTLLTTGSIQKGRSISSNRKCGRRTHCGARQNHRDNIKIDTMWIHDDDESNVTTMT